MSKWLLKRPSKEWIDDKEKKLTKSGKVNRVEIM